MAPRRPIEALLASDPEEEVSRCWSGAPGCPSTCPWGRGRSRPSGAPGPRAGGSLLVAFSSAGLSSLARGPRSG
eukprot:447219-Lingulodinium_polyedra.AAC.1